MIIYESPRRIVKTLEQLATFLGEDRKMSACREISKIHEESVRGTIAEVLAHFREKEPKGEFVLIIGGSDKKHGKASALHVAS
jgi:16S rRNA (cytidine1402-2'-O)-methyltransferase